MAQLLSVSMRDLISRPELRQNVKADSFTLQPSVDDKLASLASRWKTR
jgi:hypothetical protein